MRQALELALEALHGFIPYLPLDDETQCGRYDKAITAIKEALAQPEQCDCPKEGFCGSGSRCQDAQPKQETCKGCNGNGMVGNILDTVLCPFCKGTGIEAQPEQEPMGINGLTKAEEDATASIRGLINTTPPQRTWVGLTDEERKDIELGIEVFAMSVEDILKETEAKLKQKNGYAEEKNT